MFFDRFIKPICIILSVAIIGVMIYVAVGEKEKENAKLELVKQYELEKAPLEKQMRELEDEMLSKRKIMLGDFENAPQTLCVAAKVSNTSELSDVAEWVERFEYPVTVVLDMAVPDEDKTAILNQVAGYEDWCVILSGKYNEIIDFYNENQSNSQIIPFAYLGETISRQEEKALYEADWLGYSLGLDATTSSVNSQLQLDYLSQICHIPLADKNALVPAVSVSLQSNVGFILCMEMADYGDTFTRESVDRILERFYTEYTSPGIIYATTVIQYLEDFGEYAQGYAEAYKEYEDYLVSKKDEVDNIQLQIDELSKELYKKLNNEK